MDCLYFDPQKGTKAYAASLTSEVSHSKSASMPFSYQIRCERTTFGMLLRTDYSDSVEEAITEECL